MMQRIKLTKPRLAIWLLVGLTVPWQLGGKEPAAILVDFLLLALAAWLLLRSNEVKAVSIKGLGWLPMVFLGWAGMSMVWSVNRFQTVMWLEISMLAVGAWLMARSFGHIRALRTDWLNGYQLVATLASVWGIVIYLTGSYNRLTGSFYLANPMAAYVLPAFLLSAWRFAKSGKRFSGICAPILGAALVLTDSRSAYLVLGLAIAMGAFTRFKTKQWMRILGVVGVAVVLILTFNLMRTHLFHQSSVTQGARFSEAAKGESTSATDRLNYLKSSVAIWQHWPVLGTGAGTFGTVHPRYQYRVISASSNAHNFYAQTLAELGVVGAALLVAIALALVWVAFKHFRQRRGRAMALVVVIMLIHLGLDIDGLYPVIMVVLGALAGLMMARSEAQGKTGWPGNGIMWALVLAVVGLVPAVGAYQSNRQAIAAANAQANGEYRQAAELYLMGHSGWTYDSDVINAEGINRYTLGSLEMGKAAALADFEKALRLARVAQMQDPNDAQHVFLEARILFKRRDLSRAEAAYRRTIVLDPYNHPDYYSDLAYLYLLENKPAEVGATATAAIQQYPDLVLANRAIDGSVKGYVGALYYFRALAELGESPDRAKTDATKAVKLNPGNVDAKRFLERLKTEVKS